MLCPLWIESYFIFYWDNSGSYPNRIALLRQAKSVGGSVLAYLSDKVCRQESGFLDHLVVPVANPDYPEVNIRPFHHVSPAINHEQNALNHCQFSA